MTTTGGKQAGRVTASATGVLIYDEDGDNLAHVPPNLALDLLEQLQEHEEGLRKRAERQRYLDGVRYAMHVIANVASGDLPLIAAGPLKGPDVVVTMDSRTDLDVVALYLQREVETRPTFPSLTGYADRVTHFVEGWDPPAGSFRVSFEYSERVSEQVATA